MKLKWKWERKIKWSKSIVFNSDSGELWYKTSDIWWQYIY